MGDWIASSAEDYVNRAVEFAGDAQLLANLRVTLRARLQASPLMDEEGFARALETVYRQMWRTYCAQG